MSFLWFLLGAVVGGGIAWFAAARESDRRIAEAERRVDRELERARADARDADQAHNETKGRLLELELERASAPAIAPPPPRRVTAPGALPGDATDLKRVKGIGPALERRLKGLGIENLEQLAALSPDEVDRLNARLDFPGRIQRERWIEQARGLLGHG